MVNAFVKPGRLQGQQVFGLLDDADQSLVAVGIGANRTGVGFGQVVTNRAIADARFDVANGVGQEHRILGILLEKMESDPLGRAGADPRQFGKLGDELLKALGVGAHWRAL